MNTFEVAADDPRRRPTVPILDNRQDGWFP